MKYLFTDLEENLDGYDLEVLLHAYDLNPVGYEEVVPLITKEQKEQFEQFEKTDEASNIRALRAKKLPVIDFDTLPENLDSDMLDKLVLYSNYSNGRVWDAVSGLLTDWQEGHVIGRRHTNMDKKEEERIAAMSDEERQRYIDAEKYRENNPTEFYGNMFEPENLVELKNKYGHLPKDLENWKNEKKGK